MLRKKIIRAILISLLLIINLFLIYRYIALDKKRNVIKKIHLKEKGYGYTNNELNELGAEYNTIQEQSLRLEFWVLIFFFILVVYSLYVLIKSKLSHNDKKRIVERIDFKDLTTEKQKELLTKIYCSKCAEYTPMTFVEEKMLNGDMYVLANCSSCNLIAKIKNS